MKLNNGGFDQETTLEFFNSHILPVTDLERFTGFDGVYLLKKCGVDRVDGVTIEHVDTQLRGNHWRVQLHEKYSKEALADNWDSIAHIINSCGLCKTKKNGETIRVFLTEEGATILYTFSIPYVESVPEFNTPKERREWSKSMLGL